MAVQIFTYCRPDWEGSFHVKLCLGSGQGYIISQENRSCAITKQPLFPLSSTHPENILKQAGIKHGELSDSGTLTYLRLRNSISPRQLTPEPGKLATP